jgi:hypothetical protein
MLGTDCITDLGVHTDCKLHFHRHVDFLFSYALKLLGPIRTITFSSSALQSADITFCFGQI